MVSKLLLDQCDFDFCLTGGKTTTVLFCKHTALAWDQTPPNQKR